MKKLLLPSIAAAMACTSAVFAGPQVVESTKGYNTTQAAPSGAYGVGLYGAIQAGINAHQEYRDLDNDRRVDDRGIDEGGIEDIRFAFEPDGKVGGIVGAKLGYVFGTERIRPAVEIDGFYNGFTAEGEDFESDLKTGAFLTNFLVRFDLGRFQPYLGAGVGFYTVQFDREEVAGVRDDNSDDSDEGWAWQVVAGSDYYFTEKLSAFLEYKYLNYETDGDVFGEGRIDQHIVALGLRLHF